VLLALLAVALGPVAVTALALGRGASAPRPAPVAAPRAAPEPALETVSIAAVGDVALGGAEGLPADDGASLFAEVREALHADVVTGNLETALSDLPSSKCGAASTGCYSFRVPPSFARGLRAAGFGVLSLANNHSRDAGDAGLVDTAGALEAAGLAPTGRPGEIAIVRAGRVTVAVVGFAPYPWAADLLDPAAAGALVRQAARRADLVVVHMHAGAEGTAYTRVAPGEEHYLGERRGDPVAFAHTVVDAGADLVVGHGPHVLRALEWYRGRLIAYSLGNFSSHRNFDVTGPLGLGAILRVRLRSDGTWADGRLVGVRLEGTGAPRRQHGGEALGLVRELSRADIGGRAPRLDAAGALAPPR
jgi:hypothetical protein